MKKIFASEEEGQGMVEYALIISMIGVLVITAFSDVADQITHLYRDIGTKVESALSRVLKHVHVF